MAAKHEHEVLDSYDKEECTAFIGKMHINDARCHNCLHCSGNGHSLPCFNPKNYTEWPIECWEVKTVYSSDVCDNYEKGIVE